MICAGWIRFRASLMAMRRTSWIDQRINDGVAMLWFLLWFGVSFVFGGGGLARWRITAIMAKASITRETWRRHPCQDLLSLRSCPNSFFAVSKLSSIANRWP